jgi:hypothetical protein
LEALDQQHAEGVQSGEEIMKTKKDREKGKEGEREKMGEAPQFKLWVV